MYISEIKFVIEQQRDKDILGYRSSQDTNVFGDVHRISSFSAIYKSSLLTYDGSDTLDFQIHSFKDTKDEGSKAIGTLLANGTASINLPTSEYLEVVSEIEKHLDKNNVVILGLNVNSDDERNYPKIDYDETYKIYRFAISIST